MRSSSPVVSSTMRPVIARSRTGGDIVSCPVAPVVWSPTTCRFTSRRAARCCTALPTRTAFHLVAWRRTEGSPYELVYLVTTVETLCTAHLPLVLTDRNAAANVASFSDDPARWFADGFIDWPLMKQAMWKSTAEDPDRMDRRAAECLVHCALPWRLITQLAVHDQAIADRARAALAGAGDNKTVPVLRPTWYF